MKIKCDFCDATATGSEVELLLVGWVQAVVSAPKRITIAACPDHQQEWSDRVYAIVAGAQPTLCAQK